ncbi:hypothetical protein CYY_010175 [Polysphondylium violaceum]|uniref:CN hydrolase domain-containing protein n=1 Tax=Polysphondylium violaceum TaxID=133409 RepID=A0A8J4PJY3_9MYCE|nr:hypothetical protein CYY_010175 [Polysphondylium violaceum]
MTLKINIIYCLFFLITLSSAIKISIGNNNNDDDGDYYTASVLEFSPSLIYSEKDIISNLKAFEYYANLASKNGSQIIVFPEYGIASGNFNTRDSILPYLEYIPDPKASNEPIIPCRNIEFKNRTILETLSCIAKQNNIVVVADMGDIQPCTNSSSTNDCPSDGRFQFNTLVAFSEAGELIARYHKSHLYNEPFFNPSPTPDPITFTTSFNVTFGMLICFDIMFGQPQTDLIQQYNIKNLVYATEWVNVNYAYAREIQQSWSRLNGANILAANIGMASFFSGSGIYSNGNVLNSFVNPTMKPMTQLLTAKVPKDPSQANIADKQQHSNHHHYQNNIVNELIRSPTSINLTMVPFEPNCQTDAPPITVTADNNGLHCQFTYSSPHMASGASSIPLFSLIAYSGNFNDFFNAQICAVSICSGSTADTCMNNVFDSSIYFDSVSIQGNFESGYHIAPTITTVPIANYFGDYKSGSNAITVSNITNPFLGVGLFSIEWD